MLNVCLRERVAYSEVQEGLKRQEHLLPRPVCTRIQGLACISGAGKQLLTSNYYSGLVLAFKQN